MQVLNKVVTVYAALCGEVKKLKYEVSTAKNKRLFYWITLVYVCLLSGTLML